MLHYGFEAVRPNAENYWPKFDASQIYMNEKIDFEHKWIVLSVLTVDM